MSFYSVHRRCPLSSTLSVAIQISYCDCDCDSF